MILGINTSQAIHELCLVGEGLKIEERWNGSKDDLEKLPQILQKLLAEHALKKEDITQILVVKGPGPFMAVRTGVAFANALAFGLQTQLYEISTFELLKRKAPGIEPLLIVLPAGGPDIAISTTQVGPISSLLAQFPHQQFHVISELREVQEKELHSILLEKKWTQISHEKLNTLAETLLTFGLEGLTLISTVSPLYLKGPHITPSKDKWKKIPTQSI